MNLWYTSAIKFKLVVSSDAVTVITTTSMESTRSVKLEGGLRVFGPILIEISFRPQHDPRYGF